MILQGELEGARVLDLFGGAGALGLEALSRGSSYVTFVDYARPAVRALRDNIRHLGWRDRTEVVHNDVIRFLAGPRPETAPWDLVFIDPPYRQGLMPKVLDKLAQRADELLLPGALVLAQMDKRDETEAAYGNLICTGEREYGETRLAFFRFSGETAIEAPAEAPPGPAADEPDPERDLGA